jgi:hypothetical protein
MERDNQAAPDAEAGSAKTHDYEYAFRGTWDTTPKGRCRVRILQERGKVPIFILTELNTNPSTSVTNMVEHLVPELIARHLPHRFEVVGEDPAIVVEHYEPLKDATSGRGGKPTYDRVTFERWIPRRVWLGGRERLSLGEPAWKHLPEEEVRTLLGAEADDLR